jgi:hypothetical protein
MSTFEHDYLEAKCMWDIEVTSWTYYGISLWYTYSVAKYHALIQMGNS